MRVRVPPRELIKNKQLMQAKHYDGSYAQIEAFTTAGLKKRLAQPNVEHVEVFEATEENLKARKKLLGVKKRYQKASKNKK